MKILVLKERLKVKGFDITFLPSWQKIEELRLVANTIKHAEGDSAMQLRNIRPDLFKHFIFRIDNEIFDFSKLTETLHLNPIYHPLGGQDIFVGVADYEIYSKTLVQFWDELYQALIDLSTGSATE